MYMGMYRTPPKSGKSGKMWQKVVKVSKVVKSGKKLLWFDQMQIKHKPSARASRWLTVWSANLAG